MSITTEPKVVKPYGALYVAEYRIRNMMRFKALIVMVSIGNPFLYLLSIGVGVGALIDSNNLLNLQ